MKKNRKIRFPILLKVILLGVITSFIASSVAIVVNYNNLQNKAIKDLNEYAVESLETANNSFDYVFNQPYSRDAIDYINEIFLYNVWDRNGIQFHASFIPFDNYQYLGESGETWQNPIIFQEPNTSPLFNIWTTEDLKTPITVWHAQFIFRFTFILSLGKHYDK